MGLVGGSFGVGSWRVFGDFLCRNTYVVKYVESTRIHDPYQPVMVRRNPSTSFGAGPIFVVDVRATSVWYCTAPGRAAYVGIFWREA